MANSGGSFSSTKVGEHVILFWPKPPKIYETAKLQLLGWLRLVVLFEVGLVVMVVSVYSMVST